MTNFTRRNNLSDFDRRFDRMRLFGRIFFILVAMLMAMVWFALGYALYEIIKVGPEWIAHEAGRVVKSFKDGMQ